MTPLVNHLGHPHRNAVSLLPCSMTGRTNSIHVNLILQKTDFNGNMRFQKWRGRLCYTGCSNRHQCGSHIVQPKVLYTPDRAIECRTTSRGWCWWWWWTGKVDDDGGDSEESTNPILSGHVTPNWQDAETSESQLKRWVTSSKSPPPPSNEDLTTLTKLVLLGSLLLS